MDNSASAATANCNNYCKKRSNIAELDEFEDDEVLHREKDISKQELKRGILGLFDKIDKLPKRTDMNDPFKEYYM